MLTYNIKLTVPEKHRKSVYDLLDAERVCFNYISQKIFESKTYPCQVAIHHVCYRELRNMYPAIPSQVVIKSEQEVASTFKTLHTSKKPIKSAPVKHNLSIRLDKRIYTITSESVSISDMHCPRHRIALKFLLYDKARYMLANYQLCDPLMFFRNGNFYLSCTFNVPEPKSKPGKSAIGIDLGIKRFAATSEGQIFKCPDHNRHRRKLRYLKRCLQAKQTKSARRRLKRLARKERNLSKNFTHHLANELLKTPANTLVLEDLSKIKSKSIGKRMNNRRSQAPFFLLLQILRYKAPLLGKQVATVNPAFTYQDDHRGLSRGKRHGCRYLASDGIALDSDVNAAINIVRRHRRKLPVPCSALDGQAVVNRPIAALYGSANHWL